MHLHAGCGNTQHKIDPSGQAFSGQVPVDKQSKKEKDDDEGWGPAGMEQPANEEPSEASIHLEHGPPQLP